MKINFRFSLTIVAASLLFMLQSAQAQNTPRYKDVVVENPNAERDMKVVSDFVNALTVAGDQAKARSLVNPAYMAYGPAATDSATVDKTFSGWQENYKLQQNRKVSFLTQTFRVTSGNLKGDWVSMWGDYTFTDVRSGKTVSFPYQYTAMVVDGKIMRDRIYYDQLSVLTQLGFKVIPPGVAKR